MAGTHHSRYAQLRRERYDKKARQTRRCGATLGCTREKGQRRTTVNGALNNTDGRRETNTAKGRTREGHNCETNQMLGERHKCDGRRRTAVTEVRRRSRSRYRGTTWTCLGAGKSLNMRSESLYGCGIDGIVRRKRSVVRGPPLRLRVAVRDSSTDGTPLLRSARPTKRTLRSRTL